MRAATEPHAAVTSDAATPAATLEVVLAGCHRGAACRCASTATWETPSGTPPSFLPAQVDGRGEAVYSFAYSRERSGRALPGRDRFRPVTGGGGFNSAFVLAANGQLGGSNPNLSTAALAQTALEQAYRVWTSVASDPTRPISDLDQVFAGLALDQARADIQAVRANGQSISARLTGPIIVRNVQEQSRFRLDATVTEQWEDRLLNADGTLAGDHPGTRDRHYGLGHSLRALLLLARGRERTDSYGRLGQVWW